MRERTHTDPAYVGLPMLMHAFSDPLRLQIVELLDRNGETACAAICRDLVVSKSNASRHFRALREAGVTLSRVSGRDVHAELRGDELECFFPDLLKAVLMIFRRQKTEA